MTISITVRHHFSAGHRIPGLPGPGAKCANIHGHTFGVAWTYQVPDADADAVEFASLKKVLRGWVDEVLDHGFIVGADDTGTIDYLQRTGSKHHVVDGVPTTERIAEIIAEHAVDAAPGARLVAVEVTEGPNNEARWEA